MEQGVSKDDLIISLVKECKADLAQLRKTNHDINDELFRVSGQLGMVRQSLEIEKNDSREKFDRVHTRIDKEQQSAKEKFEKLEKVVGEIAPKINRLAQITDWATRIIVTTGVLSILAVFGKYVTDTL